MANTLQVQRSRSMRFWTIRPQAHPLFALSNSWIVLGLSLHILYQGALLVHHDIDFVVLQQLIQNRSVSNFPLCRASLRQRFKLFALCHTTLMLSLETASHICTRLLTRVISTICLLSFSNGVVRCLISRCVSRLVLYCLALTDAMKCLILQTEFWHHCKVNCCNTVSTSLTSVCTSPADCMQTMLSVCMSIVHCSISS